MRRRSLRSGAIAGLQRRKRRRRKSVAGIDLLDGSVRVAVCAVRLVSKRVMRGGIEGSGKKTNFLVQLPRGVLVAVCDLILRV